MHCKKTLLIEVVVEHEGLFRPDASSQFDGVKHNALVLEHMLVNRRIQTGRDASKILYNRDAVGLTLARPVCIDPDSHYESGCLF